MGPYERYVLPHVVKWLLGSGEVHKNRKLALAGVTGRVLEVGFGNGHNLQHYTENVMELVGIDPSPQSKKLAQEEIGKVTFPVSVHAGVAEELPFDDQTFDTVAMTYTLCTVTDPIRALSEIKRVLKPDGKFHFIEHGLSNDEKVQRWQKRLNGLQRIIGGGCNLTRDHRALMKEAGMNVESMENYYLKHGPRIMTYTYRGIASQTA